MALVRLQIGTQLVIPPIQALVYKVEFPSKQLPMLQDFLQMISCGSIKITGRHLHFEVHPQGGIAYRSTCLFSKTVDIHYLTNL
jgi:hypothetical protein